MNKWMWAAAAAAVSCSAQAAREADPANAIAFLTPVTYAPGASVDPALKADCDIPAAVEADMHEAMEHQRVGGQPTTTLDSGKTLKIIITNVHGSDGGGWTGSKVLSLDAALFENGQEIGRTHFSSETMSPNPFKGACSTLRRVTTKLSRVIVRWARDPRSAAPAPTPVEGEADPASGAPN